MPGGYRTAIFRTRLGWAGMVVSLQGIKAVVLPMTDKKSVVSELQRLTEMSCGAERGPLPPLRLQHRAVGLLKSFFFRGGRMKIAIPLDLSGTTPFQRKVWRAAQAISYGETRSYGWIAKRIGKPKAARAVGQAMGANPVPILVP